MDKITPIYVSRVLNIPLKEVEKIMKDIDNNILVYGYILS